MADLSKKPFLQQLRKILSDGIKRIDNDECSEESALGMVARFNIESDRYYDKKRFINYDEAMRMIGIKSRGIFKKLCDSNGIEQHSVGNVKVGFLREEIEELAKQTREENRKRGL